MSELITYPGHPLQPAALIAASCSGREVAVAPPDVDQKEPVLKESSGASFRGTPDILKRIAEGSALFPEAAKAEIEAWLAVAMDMEVHSRAWVEPTASSPDITDEARATSQAALTSCLGRLEAALGESNRFAAAAQQGSAAKCIAGTPSISIADIALVTVVQPLLSYVLGAQARSPYPRTVQWVVEDVGKQADVAKIMGAIPLCSSAEKWVAPAKKDTKKKKKEGKQEAADGAAGQPDAAAAEAEMDPEKAAKKAAKQAEKDAKAAKFAAKKEATAAAAAAQASKKSAAGGGGGGEDKKAAAEAKRKAEAEEAARVKAEIEAVPKGAKKDVSKAAGKAYNPQLVEATWYDWWDKCGFFQPDPNSTKPPFVIVIPPPNVTGALHIGHALTNSIQDTIVRWRRMSGYNTLWVPGTDHAGIATQSIVEKTLQREKGVTRHQLGREKFLEEVYKWVGEYGGRITSQLRRIGSSVDWSRCVFTMDSNMSRAVNEAFVRMYNDGVIYRDHRLVNWCCKLKTAVSDIEVEYIDVPKRQLMTVPGYKEPVEFGVLTSFAYPLEGGQGEIVVATTRPETMLGDTAVAVHPDDPRYKHMHGKFVVHPLNQRRLPIICDAELVDMNFGTGAVKITPAHDPNDFKTGKRHNLGFINVFDDDGCINEQGGEFAGQPRFQARVTVVQALDKLGLFRGKADNAMRFGICSRSKDVIEPCLKPQWWVKCDVMAAKSCAAVRSGELEILPKEFEVVWFRWLENIRDWCISRQLWWGHRIPAYYVQLEGESGSPGTLSEDINRWVVGKNRDEAHAVAASRYPNQKFNLCQDEDVLDTWFSSGLFPFSVFKWPEVTHDLTKFYPTSLLETGHDILFFWVARMVMMGIQLTGKVPFKQVYLHAMVRDAHGRKMSKSLGNVIDPLHVIEGISLEGLHQTLLSGNLDAKEIERAKAGQKADYPEGIEECGTDALRFGLCAYTMQARDINLDIKRIIAYRHWCNKLYNAIRFAAMNLPEGYTPPSRPAELNVSSMPSTPRWLLSKLSSANANTVKAMEEYQFAHATQCVYSFWQYELCDVYIELMKPIMALDDSTPENVANKKATRDVLWTALECGLRLLHPFMPFVTEELWQRLPKPQDQDLGPSIMVAPYPAHVPAWDNAQLEAEYSYLMDVVTKVRKLRSDYGLTKQRPNLFMSVSNPGKAEVLERSKLELSTLTTSSEVSLLSQGTEPPSGCGVAIVDDATVVHLLLKGILDPALEVVKLQKKLAEVEQRLDNMIRKMSLPGYTEKTPEAVRNDHADAKARIEAERVAALQQLLGMQKLADTK